MSLSEFISGYDKYDNAFLKLSVSDLKQIQNPLTRRSARDIERPDLHLVGILRDPKYFGFTAKYLLDIDLLPIQVSILQELWTRPFPMFVASRGFGKLLRSNELLRTKNGWVTIGEIKIGDQIYGGDGKLTKVTNKTSLQTNVNMYKISLRDGRTIECCEDHMWRVWDKNKNRRSNDKYSNVTTKEMVKNFYWIRKDGKSKTPKTTKEYRYALPINQPLVEDEESVQILHPYIVGVLLGDGSLTTNSIKVTSADIEVIDRVRELLPTGYSLKQYQSGKQYDYVIYRTNKTIEPFYKLCKKAGIWSHKADSKFIPDSYQYGSYEQRLELIRGLMDTDGYSSKSVIEFYTISNRLCNDFLNVARSLGLHCKHSTKESWFNGKQYADCNRVSIYTKKPIFTLSRKLEYIKHPISKQGASKYDKVFITNIEYLGKGDGYCISVDNDDKTYITKDYIVTHNSWLLAVYATLKCLLIPGTKIVVVGAGLRQSKVIFEYMETIWYNAPVLRSICDGESGPRRDVDRCKVQINDSWTIALPVGDGCLYEDTLLTYSKSFGTIKERHSDFVWGNGSFEYSDELYDNGIKPTKTIKTKKGFEYCGTDNHKMKVCRNAEIVWVRTDDMQIGDRILVDRSYRWHDGRFNCTEDEAYLLGSMIGDGCWTQKYGLSFATEDNQHFIPIFNSVFTNKNWVQRSKNDPHHFQCYGKLIRQTWLDFWKLDISYALTKKLPPTILSAPRAQMSACISGLFDTDGCLQVAHDKGGTSVRITFYNTSKELVTQLQYILLHYGIVSNIRSRKRAGTKWNIEYSLQISGKYCHVFAKEIGFRLPRKQIKLLEGLALQSSEKSHDDNLTFLKAMMVDIADNNISKNAKKITCSKIIAKKNITHNLVDEFLKAYGHVDDPRIIKIQELSNPNIYYDEIVDIEDGGERHVYDMHIPTTHEYCANGFYSHNSKIRGLRAHTIISDEFASLSPQVYETVIGGFAAVSQKPYDNVRDAAKRKAMKEDGVWNSELEQMYLDSRKQNQSIITGTADYDFKHFSQYHKRYEAIINSRGDEKQLEALFGEGVPDAFKNWKDYSIIRIPYELIPEGFMDDKIVARARATMHMGIYQMEYGAVFTADSDGFFKRSLIESCVTNDEHPIILPSGPVLFDPMVKGDPTRKYVYGIDPASEIDNFTIWVLELREDHTRIVYGWSTNKKNFKERQAAGLTGEYDFYAFCARKIRELMRVFPCVRIGMDSQGGGLGVMEALHDPEKMSEGEQFLWPIKEEGKEKDTDFKPGLHIVELINFASADWTAEANHGMRKDFEDKVLLFPRYDNITLGLAIEADIESVRNKTGKVIYNDKTGQIYDSLEDCVWEIEQLKNELSTIVITKTANNNRDRWDTPEIKEANSKKGRLRKDRYSALVMANMLARVIHRSDPSPTYNLVGGAAHTIVVPQKFTGSLYQDNGWGYLDPNIYQGIQRDGV